MRLWALGGSHAKIAGHFLSYAFQKQFVDSDTKQLLKNEFHLKSALQLLGSMGYLRGAIMKIGQMMANLPQIMPHELVEVFESLQFQAPPMHFSFVREVFLDEFGKEPEEMFASFEKRAFAAASLGQVHRAKLHNGKDVAVKIQYPYIAATIEADMKSFAFLLQSMRFKKDFKYLHAHIEDARSVFLKEVDYLAEVAVMEKNRQLFLGSQIVVPAHFPEYTSKRILTMDLLPGQHLQTFLATRPTVARRNHFAELISYSLVHSWFQHRTVYTDLHTGNYILMDDGRLGFIDFGCCQQFNEQRWKDEIEAEIAMFTGDREKLLKFIMKVSMTDTLDVLSSAQIDLFMEQIEWVVAPIMAKNSFDFADKEYVDSGVRLIKKMVRQSTLRTDPFFNWTNRALLGHRSLMYRLGANFDYSSLYLKEMECHLN